MNDDELISRRKKQNADRVRAYRKRKKDLGAMPSTSTVQSGKRTRKASESRWPPPPMDNRNHKGVTTALPASWVRIGYRMERGLTVGEVGHRSSHSLDEMHKRKQLLHVCILWYLISRACPFSYIRYSEKVKLTYDSRKVIEEKLTRELVTRLDQKIP
ncbi:hypothetical protein EVAR_81478_1 [Eumeta japonica]|uniref:Uncharacterized protein n=1 Tax=Eumeta variegata TaxID=151549 RepID=A0A4C1W1K4_EUMVA|nr:hypothetical protein EVAR_81478_1 [Eumeta japonica]